MSRWTALWAHLRRRLAEAASAGRGATREQVALDPQLRRALRARIAERRAEAARLLAAGETEAAEAQLKWIDQAQSVLAAETGRVRLGLGVALLCLVVLSVGITWRPPGVPVVIDATVETLTLRLAADWQAPGMTTVPVGRLEMTGKLDLAAVGLALPEDPYRLELAPPASGAARLRLGIAGAGSGTELGLGRSGSEPTIAVGGGALRGRIEAQGVLLAVESDTGEQTLPIDGPRPEVLRFALGGHTDNPGELAFASKEAFQLDGVVVDALRFEREPPAGGQGRFISTLVDGCVRLLTDDTELPLQARDRLDLGHLQGTALRIAFAPDQQVYRLRLEGRVQRLRMGPEGFARNRAPTLLARLYQQQQLAVLWGAAVFLWGLFWGLRGWLRSGL